MLRGKESLVGLVGRRRRFLPLRASLLSNPLPKSFDVCGDRAPLDSKSVGGGLESEQVGGDTSTSVSVPDCVTCPVCGAGVRGDSYIINSHLDACLSRGTKRKLTQRTLAHFNFYSKSTDDVVPCTFKKQGTSVTCCARDSNCGQDAVICLESSGALEENASKQLSEECDVKTSIHCSAEKPIDGDTVNCQVDPSSSSSVKVELPQYSKVQSVEDISRVNLETFIVARRFSTEKELNSGTSVKLLRDPDNPKDPNAIKVILADSDCCRVLGFLPRKLAQYLSPLIDKYSLLFEGVVNSVSNHSLDVVPIQITCHQLTHCGDQDQTEAETFSCLWENVVNVVRHMKNNPPSTIKYQQNFCLLIQEVLKSNCHLFTNDDKNFMDSIFSLSDDSQRLFARLYTRKGPWFRTSKVFYPEISDLQQAILELCARGYMSSSEFTNELHENDIKEILKLLSVSELHEVSCIFQKNCTRGRRKLDLITSLLTSYQGEGQCLLSAIWERTGTCIKISPNADSLIWRAERLFFLNGEQDLSAFIFVDLGMVKYPSYKCIVSDQIFSSRSDLLAYEEAIALAQIMDESIDENNKDLVLRCIKRATSDICESSLKLIHPKCSGSKVSFLLRFSASWVYSKVVSLGVSFLEREKRYQDAINLLKQLLLCFDCDGRRGYWTLRLSIDLEHVGCPNESLSVAEDGLLDQWTRSGSRMALQRRVLRLGKPPRRWKVPSFSVSVKRKIKEVHIQGRPLNCLTGMKSRFYGEDGEQCGVEQLALQYYAGEGGGWHGVHTESGIWLTIFGLLMWDIIFSDIPNVFRNKFQTAPLDLDTDSFYPEREALIESQLQKIHDGMAEEILIASWELHFGTACRGVSWDRHSLSELRAAVTCIGCPCLASLCRHLAQDYRSWSSGMPDLLLWRFHGEYRGEAKLVEVKGPNDHLSEQQRAWLLLLLDCGFNAEVCKVRPLPLSA